MNSLSDDMKRILYAVTNDFESNLRRHFLEEGSRPRKFFPIPLGMAALDTNQITLNSIRLTVKPKFEIADVKVDFSNLSTYWNLILGTLPITAEYSVSDSITSSTIEMNLNNILCEGVVSLHIDGDSFMPVNYDMKYSFSEIKTTKKNGREDIEVNQTAINEIFNKVLWAKLTDKFTYMFHFQLAPVIVEYSVQETLNDQDAELKSFSNQMVNKADGFIDSVLDLMREDLKANKTLTIPKTFQAVLKKATSSDEFKDLNLTTPKAFCQDLSTIVRKTSFSFHEDAEKTVMYGMLALKNLHLEFDKCLVSSEDISNTEANLKTMNIQNKMFLKLLFTKEGDCRKGSIDCFEVTSIGDFEVDLTDTEDSVQIQLMDTIELYLRNNVLPVLQERLIMGFNEALKRVSLE